MFDREKKAKKPLGENWNPAGEFLKMRRDCTRSRGVWYSLVAKSAPTLDGVHT
jgi:hypothetical protein